MIGCSPSTVDYELKRGTPEYSGRGRKPSYSAKRGDAVYRQNRRRCRRPKTILRDSAFIKWMVTWYVFINGLSIPVSVGLDERSSFHQIKSPGTKTLYLMLWKGELPLSLFNLPEVLARRKCRLPRISKRKKGKSIERRPQEVLDRNTFGHWEFDTVLWRKGKGEPAVLTMVERLTDYYLSLKIDSNITTSVAGAMSQLSQE